MAEKELSRNQALHFKVRTFNYDAFGCFEFHQKRQLLRVLRFCLFNFHFFLSRNASHEASGDQELLSQVNVFHSVSRHRIKLMLLVGGNGTILQGSNFFPKEIPPMIGFKIEAGKIPVLRNGFQDILNDAFKSEPKTVSQIRLSCKLQTKSGKADKKLVAVNEVSLYRGSYTKSISFDIQIGDRSLSLSGDGVLVSTPFGSSGSKILFLLLARTFSRQMLYISI